MTGKVVARERLIARLHAAVTHRLTVIVADAGFGKTELLEQWVAARHRDAALLVRPTQRDVIGIVTGIVEAIRPRAPEDAGRLALVVGARPNDPEALAGMVCSALAGTHLLLVLDNAHLLDDPGRRLVEALVRQAPPTLHVLLLTRSELSFTFARLPDPVQRFDGSDLGFDDDEMSRLLTEVVGDDEHAPAVRAFLGRWPAAVRMAAEKLAQVPPDRRTAELLRLRTHGERGLLELAHEVFDAEPARNRRLAQLVAPFDSFTAELAEALGCHDAHRTLQELVSRGIAVRLPDGYAFPRLLREFVRATAPLPPDESASALRAAGEWFESHEQPESALRCALDGTDPGWVADLLRRHGRALLEGGRDALVEEALSELGDDRDAALLEVEAFLHETRGDLDRALQLYARAIEARGQPTPWLAYRTGYLRYFRGDLDEAVTAFASAPPDPGSVDQPVLLSWHATALWARGDIEEAQELATAALGLAEEIGDARALSASHTILAMLHGHRGDRPQSHRHYDLALHFAEQAGDVQQVVRVRNNRAASLLEESELVAALPEAEAAIELAQASGLPFYLSAALTNRGEIRFHQGQYDAAVADLERAREVDVTSGNTSSATRIYLGHVYRHRGYGHAARAAYEQVLEVGRETRDATLVVPALCGLAALLAETEPETARGMVEEALSYDAGVNSVRVLLAAAWVDHAQGRQEEGARHAEQARASAEARRDRLGEAEALQLLSLCDPAPDGEDPRLTRAAELMDAVGAPVWRARVLLEQARHLPPGEAAAAVEQVRQVASALGARTLADKAAEAARHLAPGDSTPHVEVLTLGGFRVRRSGKALALTDWAEDTAPALLKRLTSASNLTWTRTALQRSMWPRLPLEESRTLLDKAIEHLRAALGPSAEEYVVARGDTVALRNADVDVHAFLSESATGLASPEAHDLLRRAESRYSGDYLEEHPGEPWAALLREEARSRYVEVARALAATAVREGEFEAAARYSRRILERDPYDEAAHVSLIAAVALAGREQEARSCYATYAMRLDELGLEAVAWDLVHSTGQIDPEKVSQRPGLPAR